MTAEISPPARPIRIRVLRSLLWLAGCLAALYVLLLALLCAQQEALLFPGSRTQGQPVAPFSPPWDAELVRIRTPRRETISALFGTALDRNGKSVPPATRPTVLLFYGNGTWLGSTKGTLRAFRKMGCNVLIPEYVGYGQSTGKPSEKACRDTAEAAYAYLLTRKEVDPKRIVAAGFSLGGAVAVDLAARKPVAGLVTLNTFTSMVDMLGRLYPFAPGFLLRHPFRSLDRIKRVRCPVFIGHGDADLLIPVEMSERLARAAAGTVTRVVVRGAGHNNLFGEADEGFFQRLRVFLSGSGLPVVP